MARTAEHIAPGRRVAWWRAEYPFTGIVEEVYGPPPNRRVVVRLRSEGEEASASTLSLRYDELELIPSLLDHFDRAFEEVGELLGIDEDDVEEYILGNRHPLILDRPNNSCERRVTWAELVTIALFLRCKASGASETSFTTVSRHSPYFAPSRMLVREAAGKLPWGERWAEGLRSGLTAWDKLFEADASGWAVAVYPHGRRRTPVVPLGL